MGQRQLPVHLLRHRRGGRAKALPSLHPPPPEVPPLPRGLGRLHRQARLAWREYWSSPVCGALDHQADGDLLRDYLLLVDERARLRERLREEPDKVVEARLRQVEGQIWRCREHLGLTPLARFRLQLQYVDARDAARRDLRAEQRMAQELERAQRAEPLRLPGDE